MMPSDWKELDGSPYPHPVLTPTTAVVREASWLTEAGVEPVLLLEIRGALDGLPVVIAVELTHEAAGKVAAGLTKAAGL